MRRVTEIKPVEKSPFVYKASAYTDQKQLSRKVPSFEDIDNKYMRESFGVPQPIQPKVILDSIHSIHDSKFSPENRSQRSPFDSRGQDQINGPSVIHQEQNSSNGEKGIEKHSKSILKRK